MSNYPRVMIGETFGHLTIVERAESDKRGQSRWLCKCDCGKTKVVHGSNLKGGRTKSCGHLQGTNHGLPDGEASFNYLYARYTLSASERDLPWGLDKELFRQLTSQSCYYCGKEPVQYTTSRSHSGVYYHNGLDRLDNTVGYLPDNVVPCRKVCNFAKRDMSFEEYITWVKQVYTHLNLDSP